MMAIGDGFGGYLTLFLAGTLATGVWRWLGAIVGSRIDVGGEAFQWVRAVATALVAGMVTRMVVFPAGTLAHTALSVRIAAFLGGIALYFVLRRNLAAGVLGGAALLVIAQLLLR
jgi:hypothetical protein